MTEYKCGLYAITNRWTEKGKEQEMASLARFLSTSAPGGFGLHSVQNVPVFGGFGGKQAGQALLVIWEKS